MWSLLTNLILLLFGDLWSNLRAPGGEGQGQGSDLPLLTGDSEEVLLVRTSALVQEAAGLPASLPPPPLPRDAQLELNKFFKGGRHCVSQESPGRDGGYGRVQASSGLWALGRPVPWCTVIALSSQGEI